jgi:hypothetical protein
MSGLSNRFLEAGYLEPKFSLKLWGKPVLFHVLKPFKHVNGSFLFVVRNDEHGAIVENAVKELEIKEYRIVNILRTTRGQAETVYRGLIEAEIEPRERICILNIDTFFNYYPKREIRENECADGLVDVFVGAGEHWSFALLDEGLSIVKMAEKKRISKFCSNGLYYFGSAELYFKYFEALVRESNSSDELYIAPIYNFMVDDNLEIKARIIDERLIGFCGTPSEYKALSEKGGEH